MKPLLSVHDLTVSVAKKIILSSVSLTWESGGVYAIMGPNGAGKSTLGQVLAGFSGYTVDTGFLSFMGEDLLPLSLYQRAQKGIFYAFQSPPTLAGVTVVELLQTIAREQKRDPHELFSKIQEFSSQLEIPSELLSRSLNDGFSGGERKKMELLQMAVLSPRVAIVDEITAGVDADTHRVVTTFLTQWASLGHLLLLITHDVPFLSALPIQRVDVLCSGRVVTTGGISVAEHIACDGYGAFLL